MSELNDYKFEHCQPTIEHFLTEFKGKDVKIYTPRGSEASNENIDFANWSKSFFKSVVYANPRFWYVDGNKAHIAYINFNGKPYELLKYLCDAFDYLKTGGILICNHFYENCPNDDFEQNPRYGLDAFAFVTQYRQDILYKGNQIIIKKL